LARNIEVELTAVALDIDGQDERTPKTLGNGELNEKALVDVSVHIRCDKRIVTIPIVEINPR
jgi:hypothetical protein